MLVAYFLCATLHSAGVVGEDMHSYLNGKELPSDCYWTGGVLDNQQRSIVLLERVDQVTNQEDKLVDVAYVNLWSGRRGYTAGYSPLVG